MGMPFGCFPSAQGWSAVVYHPSPGLSYMERKLRLLAKWVLWRTPADPSSAQSGHRDLFDLKLLKKKMFLPFNLNMRFYLSLQFYLAVSLPKSIIIERNTAEHELKMRPLSLKTECELSVRIWGNLKWGYFFFLPIHCIKELLPCIQFWFPQKVFWKGRRVHRSAERMAGVSQSPSCSGKGNNPSLQAVMKARLRVISWESEYLSSQISESRYFFKLAEIDKIILCGWKFKLSKFKQNIKNEFLNLLHGLSILFKSVFLKDHYSAFSK